jgi:hypothetical protein
MDALSLPRVVLALPCSNGFYALRAAQIASDRVAALCLVQTPCAADMARWSERVVPWPVKVPGLGQLLQWWNRRATAQLWYGVLMRLAFSLSLYVCDSHSWKVHSILCCRPRRYKIALPSKSPAIPDFQRTAVAALDGGGCFCLASVVQGLASSLPATAPLSVPATVPVLGVWGERDRSHAGNFTVICLASLQCLDSLCFDISCRFFWHERHARHAAQFTRSIRATCRNGRVVGRGALGRLGATREICCSRSRLVAAHWSVVRWRSDGRGDVALEILILICLCIDIDSHGVFEKMYCTVLLAPEFVMHGTQHSTVAVRIPLGATQIHSGCLSCSCFTYNFDAPCAPRRACTSAAAAAPERSAPSMCMCPSPASSVQQKCSGPTGRMRSRPHRVSAPTANVPQ